MLTFILKIKETIDVISSDPPFIVLHIRFTMVPLKGVFAKNERGIGSRQKISAFDRS